MDTYVSTEEMKDFIITICDHVLADLTLGKQAKEHDKLDVHCALVLQLLFNSLILSLRLNQHDDCINYLRCDLSHPRSVGRQEGLDECRMVVCSQAQ